MNDQCSNVVALQDNTKGEVLVEYTDATSPLHALCLSILLQRHTYSVALSFVTMLPEIDADQW